MQRESLFECSLAKFATALSLLIAAFANAEDFYCAGGDVACLSGAISAADLNAEDDTIRLGYGEFTLNSALPSVQSRMRIIGAHAKHTTIRRDAHAPDFIIFVVESSGNLSLEDVTLSNGRGAIMSTGTLRLDSCVLDNNVRDDGGAVWFTGTVTITDSIFSSNSASSDAGGAIQSNSRFSQLFVDRSTFIGNVAKNSGGAISMDFGVIRNSAFVNNSAAEGGAIYASAPPEGSSATQIVNSTFSGNNATGNGGAITVRAPGGDKGDVIIRNSTITDNSALRGGGVGVVNDTLVSVTNSIVAGNVANGAVPSDCIGRVVSLGYNIVGRGTGCPNASVGDLAVNPGDVFATVLGPLQNNGGPTDTHALLPASPAIDAGAAAGCTDVGGIPLDTDQRGEPRPADGNDDGRAACDVGSFEYQRGILDEINNFVRFDPYPSTFSVTYRASGCPTDFVGKFSFAAKLKNVSESTLSGLHVRIAEISTGNQVLTASGSAVDDGALLPVPDADGYTDGILTPNEYVDMDFKVCLSSRQSFRFVVDVIGERVAEAASIFKGAVLESPPGENAFEWFEVDYDHGPGFLREATFDLRTASCDLIFETSDPVSSFYLENLIGVEVSDVTAKFGDFVGPNQAKSLTLEFTLGSFEAGELIRFSTDIQFFWHCPGITFSVDTLDGRAATGALEEKTGYPVIQGVTVIAQ